MLGMRSKDASGSALAKKRTGVLTSSPQLADMLAKFQCDSTRRHLVLEGGRPKACEEYPDEFCELVCREVLSERTRDSRDVTYEINLLTSLLTDQENAEQVASAPAYEYSQAPPPETSPPVQREGCGPLALPNMPHDNGSQKLMKTTCRSTMKTPRRNAGDSGNCAPEVS